MGVAGSGKTTVGTALADALGWDFVDADDHHSAASLAKIGRGEGLTDADRAPWLARLGALVRERLDGGPPTVLAWLDVPADVLAQRLAARQGHVAGPDLLPSQLATLEPPHNALRLDGAAPVRATVDVLRRAVGS